MVQSEAPDLGGAVAVAEPPVRPALTLSDAAQACGVSRITVRRRLEGGAFPNAYRGDGIRGPGSGPWLIPITDLIGAGLHPNRYEPGPTIDQSDGMSRLAESPPERAELDRLRVEMADLRRRAEVAEAVADERARMIEGYERMLRMLERGESQGEQSPIRLGDPSTEHVKRPAWFRRRR